MNAFLQSSLNVGIQELYASIQHDPKFLNVHKDAMFFDTPLHGAVRCGNAELALEILRLMPSQGRKMNLEGYSPLDIALRGENVDLVRHLIKFDPELIRVPGREGITPLHYAAEQNKVELMAEFLLYCPDAIEDLTIRGETALHVAQKKRNFKALRVLYGWVRWKGREGVLKLRDWEGITVSDPVTETETDGTEVMVHKNFVDYLCSSPGTGTAATMRKIFKVDSETRNAILVVAVLIATATFQAVFTPPGDFSDRNPVTNSNTSPMSNATLIVNENKDGDLMMSRKDFTAFAAVNSLAFGSSVAVILMFLPFNWSNIFLYVSTGFFTVTYIVAIKITSPDQKIDIVIAVLFVLLPYLILGGEVGWRRGKLEWKRQKHLVKDETYWKRIVDDTYNARRNREKVQVEVERSSSRPI